MAEGGGVRALYLYRYYSPKDTSSVVCPKVIFSAARKVSTGRISKISAKEFKQRYTIVFCKYVFKRGKRVRTRGKPLKHHLGAAVAQQETDKQVVSKEPQIIKSLVCPFLLVYLLLLLLRTDFTSDTWPVIWNNLNTAQKFCKEKFLGRISDAWRSKVSSTEVPFVTRQSAGSKR